MAVPIGTVAGAGAHDPERPGLVRLGRAPTEHEADGPAHTGGPHRVGGHVHHHGHGPVEQVHHGHEGEVDAQVEQEADDGTGHQPSVRLLTPMRPKDQASSSARHRLLRNMSARFISSSVFISPG